MGVDRREVWAVGRLFSELASGTTGKAPRGFVSELEDALWEMSDRQAGIIRHKFDSEEWRFPEPYSVVAQLSIPGRREIACRLGPDEVDVWRVWEARPEEAAEIIEAFGSLEAASNPDVPYTPFLRCRKTPRGISCTLFAYLRNDADSVLAFMGFTPEILPSCRDPEFVETGEEELGGYWVEL